MQDIGALRPLKPQPARVDTPDFDIVLVHGRGIDADKTWVSLWSEDCVRDSEQRKMRVFAFEYRDRVNDRYRLQSICMSAEKLLQDLVGQRSGCIEEMRPIVFIGHSTGGVIIKQALIAAQHDPRFRNIAYSACATIFLATPHRGYKHVIQRIFDADSRALNQRMGITAPSYLVCDDDIEGLNNISTEFLDTYRDDLLFRNYVEGIPPEGLHTRVVEGDNASLRLPGYYDEPPWKNRDHFQMCTFDIDVREGPRWLMSIIDQVERDAPKFKRGDFDENRYKLLQWLGTRDILLPSPSSPVIPTEGTCNWIERQKYFQRWFDWNENYRKLWITGGLGCGKTFLAEHIRLLAMNQLRTVPDNGDLVIHFCLGSMKEGLITPRRMLACLLHSILVSYPKVTGFTNQDLGQHGTFKDKDLEVVWCDTIGKITEKNASRRLTLIVDEVDRLVDSRSEPELGPVLRAMSGELNDPAIRTRSKPDCKRIRVLVLSRPGGYHGEALQEWCRSENQIPQNETKGDIKKTVEKELNILAKLHKLNDQVKADISEKIRNIAGDMYILAHLALKEIASAPEERSAHSLRDSIAGFYDSILGRLAHSDHPGGEVEETKRFLYSVLFWMTYQGHAMDEEELRLGMAMLFKVRCPVGSKSYEGVVDEELVNNPLGAEHPNLTRDILLKCAPLVRYRSDYRFEPIHRTLKEFLATSPKEFEELQVTHLRHHRLYAFDNARADGIISSLCMDYLLLPSFSDAGKLDLPSDEWRAKVKTRIDEHDLVVYAARHWIYHAKLSSKKPPFTTNLASILDSASREYHLLELSKHQHARCWLEVWWYDMKRPAEGRFSGLNLQVCDIFGDEELMRTDRLMQTDFKFDLAQHLARPSEAPHPKFNGFAPVLELEGTGPAPNPPTPELPAPTHPHPLWNCLRILKRGKISVLRSYRLTPSHLRPLDSAILLNISQILLKLRIPVSMA
ncbi:hypothetical protein B0I37DRAFT_408906 [Chaetomium sp. MPI-CAGE-AT-0009]|nr:hypothetical protein B0I37DRAFT_408906 [Chaetomium sp. MPI-CAGE-AT-0009]